MSESIKTAMGANKWLEHLNRIWFLTWRWRSTFEDFILHCDKFSIWWMSGTWETGECFDSPIKGWNEWTTTGRLQFTISEKLKQNKKVSDKSSSENKIRAILLWMYNSPPFPVLVKIAFIKLLLPLSSTSSIKSRTPLDFEIIVHPGSSIPPPWVKHWQLLLMPSCW